jgi:hypothetical protein
MADISQEIANFQSASRGEEVRDSMVSLANKLNGEVETNTRSVQDMTVGASTLAPGSQATAEKTINPSTGAININFGIPTGERGPQGAKGDKGDKGDTPDSMPWSSITQKPDFDALFDEKVDKVNGKGLSTNDYTTDEKTKLEEIEDGAQVNVKPDLNATSGDAQIINNPFSVTNGMIMITFEEV